MKKFKYMVARPWDPEDPKSGLCIYTYFNEIHSGTMKDAEKFLEYVRRQEPKKAEHYSIYKVKYTKVE